MSNTLSDGPRERWRTKPTVGFGIDWSATGARGLYGAWLGAEGGGGILYDLAGGANGGTPNNLIYQGTANPWIMGPDGPGLNFPTSTTAYFQSASAIFDPSSTNFAASIWFQTSTIGTFQNILSGVDGTGTGRGWFGITAAGLLQSSLSGTPTVGVTTLVAGLWYLATFTLTGTTHSLYLNGRLEATATVTVTANVGTIRVGVSRLATGALSGAVGRAGLLIWKVAPSAGSVQRLYTDPYALYAPIPSRRTATRCNAEPGVLAYHRRRRKAG